MCDRECGGIIRERLCVIGRVDKSSGGCLRVTGRVDESSGGVCDWEGGESSVGVCDWEGRGIIRGASVIGRVEESSGGVCM